MSKKHYNGCVYEECHFCQCHYCFNYDCVRQKKSPKNEYLETCEDCRALRMGYDSGGGYSIGRANCEDYIGTDWNTIDGFLKKDLEKQGL